MSTISGKHFRNGVAARQQDREEQRNCAPSINMGAPFFIRRSAYELRRQQQTERRDNGKNPINAFGRNQRHCEQAAQAPAKQPNGFGRHLAKRSSNPPSTRAKIDNCECDYQYAPWSKFVQQMRQIKIKWLRPMNRFPETRNEFAHYNFIEKARLKTDATHNPQKENTERSEPGPPTAPRTWRITLSPPPLE